MTRPKRNDAVINVTKQDLMEMLTQDDALKALLQTMLQEVLVGGSMDTLTGMLAPRAGETHVADFGPFGSVSVTFT